MITLSLISTGLSVLVNVLKVAQIVKAWRKPAGYLIRFINWVGSWVDWWMAKYTALDSWLNGKKDQVDQKIVEKKISKKRKRRYGRWRRKNV